MKRTIQHGQSPANRYPITVTNDSGEEIPAHAIMAVTGATDFGDDTVYTVDKPAGTSGAVYLVNSPSAIADDGYGAATDFYPTDVAYDDAETPAVNEEWGPVSSSWLLTKSGSGWVILGGAEDEVVRAMKSGGSASNLRFARVMASGIDGADGPLEADWTTGNVKFQDDTTGVLDDDETEVTNKLIDVSFVEDSQVIVDTGSDPPVVISGTCAAVDWGDLMAQLQPGPQCCCNCPTKEESGMPDSLAATFNVTSSDDTGMPSDSVIADCNGNDYYYRFSESSAIIDLLTSITFDYVETGSSTCGACCYHYSGRSDYSPDCPEDFSGEAILLGDSPFSPKATGDGVTDFQWTGEILDPLEIMPDAECCPTGTLCVEVEQNSLDTVAGVLKIPMPLFCTAEIFICVLEDIVTICVPITVYIPCDSFSGSCRYQYPTVTVNDGLGVCVDIPPSNDCEGDEDCVYTTADIEITITADISLVAGATLWDKIKAAVLEGEYEYVACSCAGGGCVDTQANYVCGCYMTTAIICAVQEIDPNDFEFPYDTCNADIITDHPVDIECLYSVGELTLELADE